MDKVRDDEGAAWKCCKVDALGPSTVEGDDGFRASRMVSGEAPTERCRRSGERAGKLALPPCAAARNEGDSTELKRAGAVTARKLDCRLTTGSLSLIHI